jgi:hypothetical protein
MPRFLENSRADAPFEDSEGPVARAQYMAFVEIASLLTRIPGCSLGMGYTCLLKCSIKNQHIIMISW